jgi:hypothetical protein
MQLRLIRAGAARGRILFAFVNACCWTWCRADSILTNTVQFIPWAIRFHPKAPSNAAPYVRR